MTKIMLFLLAAVTAAAQQPNQMVADVQGFQMTVTVGGELATNRTQGMASSTNITLSNGELRITEQFLVAETVVTITTNTFVMLDWKGHTRKYLLDSCPVTNWSEFTTNKAPPPSQFPHYYFDNFDATKIVPNYGL